MPETEMRAPGKVGRILILGCLAASVGVSYATDGAPAATSAEPPEGRNTAGTQGAIAQKRSLSIPFYFEKNLGQTDPRVDFIARGGPHTTYLTRGEAVTVVRPHRKAGSAGEGRAHSVRMKLVGGFRPQAPKGLGKLRATTSYFVGSGTQTWRTGIPAFKKVLYKQAYRGVDLVYRGTPGGLEYDFVVRRNSDPGQIKLSFSGAERILIDRRGDLVLETPGGKVKHSRPFVYQWKGGRKEQVRGGYVMRSGPTVGFWLGRHDPTRTLIIDPKIAYSSYLGGSLYDRGYAVAADASGGAYVAGTTNSLDFPEGNKRRGGRANAQRGGDEGYDSMVVKLDTGRRGSESLVWAAFVGGSSAESALALTVAESGNVVVAGQTRSSDFPWTGPGPGSPWTKENCEERANLGNPLDWTSAYVMALNPEADHLVYATCIKGRMNISTIGRDLNAGVAVDGAGNAYLTGETWATDGFATGDARQTEYGGGLTDAFLVKISADGYQIAYSTYFGGAGGERGNGIAAGSDGRVYITGRTDPENGDVFVAGMEPSGAIALRLLFYSTLGGSGLDEGNGVATDGSGNLYLTGTTRSRDFPTRNAAQAVTKNAEPASVGDAFVAKWDTSKQGDQALVYSTYLGGSLNETGYGVAADKTGHAYVSGTTGSSDFPARRPFQPPPPDAPDSAFVTKVAPDGKSWVYSSHLGGSFAETVGGIALTPQGSVLITGQTDSRDFPQGEQGYQTTYGGGEVDFFFVQLDPILPHVTGVTPSTGPSAGGTAVSIQGTGFSDPALLADAALAGEAPVTVTFGDTPAARVELRAPGQIHAVSPPGQAGTVDVRITTFEGTSPVVPEDRFTYIDPVQGGRPADGNDGGGLQTGSGSGSGSGNQAGSSGLTFQQQLGGQTSGLPGGFPPPAPPAPGAAPVPSSVLNPAQPPTSASAPFPAPGTAASPQLVAGPGFGTLAQGAQGSAAGAVAPDEGEDPAPGVRYSFSILSEGLAAAGTLVLLLAVCTVFAGENGRGRYRPSPLPALGYGGARRPL